VGSAAGWKSALPATGVAVEATTNRVSSKGEKTMKHKQFTLVALLALTFLLSANQAAARTPGAGITTRVSVASDGTQSNAHVDSFEISADGRYVAFATRANNLVSGDTNSTMDVFVHDRQTGQTTRVSVSSKGWQATNHCEAPDISADGRYVAFQSAAVELVYPDDTNNHKDIFVHDRQTGSTTRVSVSSLGTQANGASVNSAISADGRFVTFSSWAANLVPFDLNARTDIFVHDRQMGETTLVSVASDGTQGNSDSIMPMISGDGRYVTFYSTATNLVTGDTNSAGDIFLHDRQTGQTTRVSVASDGTQGNFGADTWHAISADGRYITFESFSSNLVPGDTNGAQDIFVHDRQTGQMTRVSVASNGTQQNGDAYVCAISGDGRYVAFDSYASNLVSGDTNGVPDIFVHDRQTGQTTRVSVASDGAQGNLDSAGASLSSDGRYVAFSSWANNLVSGDTNTYYDIFVHDRGAIPTNFLYLPLILR
jgi:tricorn protease-like protein